MKKFKKFINSALLKYGPVIASLAFFAVTISANSPCNAPFYEPEEPAGIARFKRFGK